MLVCNICPHQCGVDRNQKLGVCQAPNQLKAAQAKLHFHEEPCISGTRGSGTIFFSHCNLQCRFCQNYRISQEHFGKVVSPSRFTEIMLELQAQGAQNINLVSPTPYLDCLVGPLETAKAKGQLKIPIVWNSNGYENVDALNRLSGLVDVYLSDLKYFSDEIGRSFSGVENYFEFARMAILEMRRQVPRDEFDGEMMRKGLIVRHLVLPGQVDDSKRILEWLAANLGTGTIVSLMAQYYPAHRAAQYPPLDRRLTEHEYAQVCDNFIELGFSEGYVQELSSAEAHYTPDFKLEGV